jgi:prepilin-type N-terminal cleavage/methylation domain-containing protein
MIQRLRDKREQDEAGFTLVELLVVIVILGILAAIVVFAVGGITDKGTANAVKTDASSLQAAEEAEFASYKPTPALPIPVYVGMAQLQTGGFLRTASTYNVVCLSTTSSTPSTPASLLTAGVDYFVLAVPPAIALGATCPPTLGKTGYIAS